MKNDAVSIVSAEHPVLQAIDGLLDSVDALPPSPYPLPELFRALTDPDTDIEQVVEIITYDVALTSKLLRLCNSAYFSRGEHVNDVGEAISRLGFQSVYRVVASIKGPDLFQPKGGAYGFNPEEMWKHSVMSALNAQYMAEDFGEDSSMLFTAGLLHDMGKVILGMGFQGKYGCVIAEARREGKPLGEVERAVLGMDHAMVGARLLERWKFSAQMVSMVRFHHHPQELQNMERFPAIIQVASAMSHLAYPEAGEGGLMVHAEAGLEVFGWSLEEMGKYAKRMEKNKEVITMLMRMGK